MTDAVAIEMPTALIEAKETADDALAQRADVDGQIAVLALDRKEIATRLSSATAEIARLDKLIAKSADVALIGARGAARKAAAESETALDRIDQDIAALHERGAAIDDEIENAATSYEPAFADYKAAMIENIERELVTRARALAPLLAMAHAVRAGLGGLRQLDTLVVPSVLASRPLVTGAVMQIGNDAPTVFATAWAADPKCVAERNDALAARTTFDALAVHRNRRAATQAALIEADPELQKRHRDEQRQRQADENAELRRRVAEARENEAAEEDEKWAKYRGTTAIRMPHTPAPYSAQRLRS